MELRNDLIRFLLLWLPVAVFVLLAGAVMHVLADHPRAFETAVLFGRVLGGTAFVAMIVVIVAILWSTFRKASRS